MELTVDIPIGREARHGALGESPGYIRYKDRRSGTVFIVWTLYEVTDGKQTTLFLG